MQLSGPFSFVHKNTLIIWHTEEICKTNFYDRNAVLETAKALVRRGAVSCAICKGPFKVHGSYKRHLKDEDSERHYGWVVQVHCDVCDVYPALIPDFIMPYKHYKAEVIEMVIVEFEKGKKVEHLDGCAAEASTMRRWVKQFSERGAQAVGWLLSTLRTVFEQHISALKLRNKTILEQLARLLKAYSFPKSGSIIGRVNIILTTQNCGFL